MKAFVSQARALKAERGVASRRDVKFFVKADDAAWATIEANLPKLLRMAGAAAISRGATRSTGWPRRVTPLGTLGLDLARLDRRRRREARGSPRSWTPSPGTSPSTEARLANPAFVGKAPPAVLEGARRQLAEQQAKRGELERLLEVIPVPMATPAASSPSRRAPGRSPSTGSSSRSRSQAARSAGCEVTLLDLNDYVLPLYNGDLEDREGMPANAARLIAHIAGQPRAPDRLARVQLDDHARC